MEFRSFLGLASYYRKFIKYFAKVVQIFKKTKLIDLLSYNIADNAAEISKIYFSFYREIYTQNLYVTAFYKVSLLFSLRTYMSKHS